MSFVLIPVRHVVSVSLVPESLEVTLTGFVFWNEDVFVILVGDSKSRPVSSVVFAYVGSRRFDGKEKVTFSFTEVLLRPAKDNINVNLILS